MGYFDIAFGIFLAAGAHWVGVDLARSKPCRTFFWIRVLLGIPIHLLAATLIYRGFLII